jgi:hypothetical protein
MKVLHLYEIKMLDGTQYRGEISYRDDKMVVLKISNKPPQQRLRLFYNGIVSIREMGWQKTYALK